jgi:hypothetical protein
MGRRNLLRSSSYPDVTGNWRRARLADADIFWARQNLTPDARGATRFEQRESFVRVEREPNAYGLLPPDLSDRVCFREGEKYPLLLIQTTNQTYKLRELAEEARLRRDPELAPHVNFRKLAHGNTAVAWGFLKEFGPLTLGSMDPSEVCWVDLNDFWRRHSRFVAISRLYENLGNREELRKAFLDMVRDLDSLNAAGPAKLGWLPDQGKKFIAYARIRTPEAYSSGDQDPWLNHELLRIDARELIFAELTLQTEGGIGTSWIPVEEDGIIKFRPERVILSLWAGIWERFGLDTWTGMTWRACRVCGKYFYPLQRNSDCCTPEHQARWSKREYARRAREKAKIDSIHRDDTEGLGG